MANFRARNKLVYLVPFLAAYIDVVVGTATLKTILEQVSQTIPNEVSIPSMAAALVALDLTLGGFKESFTVWILGLVCISVVPIFTIVEGFNELQNNLILVEAIGTDLTQSNTATVLKYFGLSALSFSTHFILFKQSKVILLGFGFYDVNGTTNSDIEKEENEIDGYY